MKLKIRLLLGLLLAAFLVPIFTSTKATASHSNTRWIFHWVDKSTVEMKDTRDTFANQTATFKADGVRPGRFSATINFDKYQGCADVKQSAIIFNINAEAYENAAPPSPTPIDSGNYDSVVDKRCGTSDELINQLNSKGSTVGFVISPTQGQVTDTSGFKSGAAAQEQEATCESLDKGVGWITCAIIGSLNKGTVRIDHAIFNELRVNECDFETSDTSKCPDLTTGKNYYEIWSVMRYLSMAFLVIAGLVMIISQAIGEGPFDAYTIKKIMPRLLVAVIGVTLSWELLNFVIGFTNDLGSGVRALIYAPFGGADEVEKPYDFSFGEGSLLSIGVISFATAGIIGLGTVGLLSLALTAFIAVLIGFVVIVFRKVLIALLVVLAPIAIISFILPNTQGIWNFWRGTLSKALLMFPLIMVLLASGRVFASVSEGGGQSLLQSIIAVVAYYGPYFLIPATFKFAGGAIATVSGLAGDRTRGIFDRQRKLRGEQRQVRYERMGRRVVQTRADLQYRLNQQASRRGVAGGFALRRLGGAIGGYNIQASDAARRASVGKELNDQIATGRDEEIRGLTVNKRWAETQGPLQLDSEGNRTNGHFRVTGDGTRQYMSLGGRWIGEADVDNGHKRWGRDTYAQQAALSYEMRKAQTESQLQNIAKNYRNVAVAPGGWSMTREQAGGAWIGAAFENQNQHLEYKYTDWERGVVDRTRGRGLAEEIYEKRGSYPLAQMSSNTIEELKNTYNNLQNSLDPDDLRTQQQIAAIAETFMHELSVGGGPVTGMAGKVPLQQPGGSTGQRMASTPGAAHVAERVVELARLTGVYQNAPTNPVPPASPQK